MNALHENIILNFRSNEPLYLQIARQVEQMVARGELHVGDQLPTVREMATGLRINFNTVARAYRTLDDARLISTQRGRGTYIWEQPSEETLLELRQKSLQELAKRFLSDSQQLGFNSADALETIIALVQSGETTISAEEDRENEEL